MRSANAARRMARAAPPPFDDGDGKILAVDDDPANLIALRAILADIGRPVVCARSGEEALRHLLTDDFAVILLDVLMPGIDGYETAAIIRARDRTRHVPIIFLSAVNKDPSHLFRGYAAGAVDYVFKPVEPVILRSKVMVFIELHRRAQEIQRQAELERRLLADNLRVRAQQMRTAEALERSLAQQTLVIEALPLALYVASASDGYRRRNFVGGRLEPLLGKNGERVQPGESWLARVHPDDRVQLEAALVASQRTGSLFAEYRFLGADGNYRWYSDRAVRGAGPGRSREQFGMLLDISDRRMLEEQLAHAQKIEAVGQMTGGIAHDFNNMLSVIIGSLDRALARAPDDERLRRHLDLAMQAAASCADLTKRLLGFARRQALQPKVLRLEKELGNLQSMFERLVGDKITASVECEPGTWPVHLDASQLEAAIVNLVLNARDAMPEGGHIVVATRNRPASDPALGGLNLAPGDYVELSVTDNGSGMPEEVRKRAFEPFFTTKETGKGTGLGLSSIYGFMQQSGGTAVIDSTLGEGTSVRLFLPRGRSAERESGDRRRSAEPVALGHCRVLLVEDDERVRAMAAALLEDLGCPVVEAASGEEALRLLEERNDVSLLFSDCMMPGALDGPGLAAEVRRRWPAIRVLLTSGVGGLPASAANGAEVPFLAKPYSAPQLLDSILSLGLGTPPATEEARQEG